MARSADGGYHLAMLGETIRERLIAKEFRTFTLVLANGERIDVKHPDSVTLSSVEVRGRRVFASYVNILETKEDAVIERVVALLLIAQVIHEHRLNGA